MSILDNLLADDEGNYADVPTLFGRAQVYDVEDDAGNTFRVLDIAGTWQSASYVDHRWDQLVFGYHQVFDRAFAAPVHVGRALMLGGGALSYPKHVVAAHDDVQVDVVELDHEVTELARRWFFLDRLSDAQQARLQVRCADAVAFLAEAAAQGARYDLVVNDLFAAEEPTAELMAPEGLALVREVLAPEGLYVTNVVSALRGRKKRPLRMVQEALATTFEQVETVSLGADEPRTPDNNVVFATSGGYSLSGVVGSR